jgi:hypothetical protein
MWSRRLSLVAEDGLGCTYSIFNIILQVDGLILVVNKSHQVEEQRNDFLQNLGLIVTTIKERTSSHQAISDSLDSLQVMNILHPLCSDTRIISNIYLYP